MRFVSQRNFVIYDNTLLENNLEPIETIVPISARLIANKTGYKFKYDEISKLCQKLSELK